MNKTTARPPDGTVRPYDQTIFSKNTAGAYGRCYLANHGRGHRRCGPPVVMVYHYRVRDRSGLPGGFWQSLCASCGTRLGYELPKLLVEVNLVD